jgi:signal transduction histidine kinase
VYYKLFFLLCFVSVSIPTTAQELSPVDSITKEIAKARDGKLVPLYYNLAFEFYLEGKVDEAIETLETTSRNALAFGDSLYLVKAGRLAGQIYFHQNDMPNAVKYSLSVLPIAVRNTSNPDINEDLKKLYNNLGVSYTFLAKYDSALDAHFKCLVLHEQSNNPYDMAVSLNNIGLLYFKLKSYPKSLDFYERALRELEKSDVQDFKGRLLINIGLCHNQLKKYDLARSYIEDGLKFCGDNCGAEIDISGNFGLGVSYFQMQDFAIAERYFKKSLGLAQANKDTRFELENLVYLAKVSNELRDPDQAQAWLIKAEPLAEQLDFVQLKLDVYKAYYAYFTLTENHEKASVYQKKYIDMTERVFNEKLLETVSKIETDFDQRENIRTIRDKELALDQSRKLNFAIAGLFLLAGALAVVMFRTTRIVRRVNVALSEARNQLQVQNRELDQLVEARTKELNQSNTSLRKAVTELDHFIYKTSHDIRGPLATLKGMTDVALMDVKDPLARDYFEKLDITAEKLNSVLTRLMIVNQINNAPLVPVKVNVSQVIESILLLERKKGIPVRMNVSTFIPPDMEVNSEPQLLRIVLENLIDNAIKYYNQSERVDPFVRITAVVINKQLLVEVVDNGIGISEDMRSEVFKMFTRASERSETGGVGLYLSQQAAEKLGGNISFETTPEKYTKFTAVIPADFQKVIDLRQAQTQEGAVPAEAGKNLPDASRKAS